MMALILIFVALAAVVVAISSGATAGGARSPAPPPRDVPPGDSEDHLLYEMEPYFPDRQALNDLVATRHAEQQGRETGGD